LFLLNLRGSIGHGEALGQSDAEVNRVQVSSG
jgi:hypothetical protein